MPEQFRRDKGVTRVIAFLDIILAIILFVFYTSVAVATKLMIFNVSKGPFSKVSLVLISLLMWAIAFGINYLQLSTAYRLFLVTFQDALGPRVAVERSLSWLRIAALLFGFVSFKMIFSYLRFENPIWFFWFLCVIEIVFRLFGMYFVREFCDDLKHHIRITNSQPVAKVSTRPSNDPQVVVSNHVISAV